MSRDHSSRVAVWLGAVILCAMAACGSTPRTKARPGQAYETKLPALRFIPADTSYALVSSRLGSATQAIQRLVEIGASLAGVPQGQAEALLRELLGVNPGDRRAVFEAGFDVDASSALFAQHGLPTLLVPVRDPERVRRFVDARRPDRNVETITARGRDVFVWTVNERWALCWVVMDDWLALHLADAGPVDTAWLDELMTAATGASLAAEPDFADAVRSLERARGKLPALFGLLRPSAVARDLAVSELAGCASAIARSVQAVRVVSSVDDRTVELALELVLSADAAQALSAHLAPPPPPGFDALARSLPLSAQLTVDLSWLDQLRTSAGCPELGFALRDPLGQAGKGTTLPGYHLAMDDVDIDSLSGRAALFLTLRDPSPIEDMLDDIPGRSLLERRRKLKAGGTEIDVRELRGLPGLPRLAYKLSDDRFLAGLGSGMLDSLVAEGLSSSDTTGPKAMVKVSAVPSKLPNLGAAVAGLLSATGDLHAAVIATALVGQLKRYQTASLAAWLDRGSVRVTARITLAP